MGPANMINSTTGSTAFPYSVHKLDLEGEYISPQNPEHILDSLKILVYAHLVFSHSIHIPGLLNQMAFDSVLIC